MYIKFKSVSITLHNHGLSGRDLWTVTQAYILSRLTYACSAWWGFCSLGERDQLAAVVTRLVKKNYLPPDQPTLHEMVATADNRLFIKLLQAPPMYLLHSSHSRNHTPIICESAHMTFRSLYTKQTFQIKILSLEQY